MEFRVAQGIHEDICTSHRDSCPQILPRLVPINWFAATTSEKVASVHPQSSMSSNLPIPRLRTAFSHSALYHCISTTNRQFLVSGRDTILPPPSFSSAQSPPIDLTGHHLQAQAQPPDPYLRGPQLPHTPPTFSASQLSTQVHA